MTNPIYPEVDAQSFLFERYPTPESRAGVTKMFLYETSDDTNITSNIFCQRSVICGETLDLSDFVSLRLLVISGQPNLTQIKGLRDLPILEKVEINECPNLQNDSSLFNFLLDKKTNFFEAKINGLEHQLKQEELISGDKDKLIDELQYQQKLLEQKISDLEIALLNLARKKISNQKEAKALQTEIQTHLEALQTGQE